MNSDLRIKCEKPTGALLEPIYTPYKPKISVLSMWGENFCGNEDTQSIRYASLHKEAEMQIIPLYECQRDSQS